MAKNITPEKLFRLYKSQVKFLEQYYLTLPEKGIISLPCRFQCVYTMPMKR